MKKIFYILAAAIVALGTVACENEGLDNINPNINVDGDTVSFVAGINRTDLEGVATVWDAEDTIVVTWNGINYEFKNAETGDKNTFKCTAEGLSAIVDAENIKAVYSNNKDGKVDSAAGVAGALLEYEGAFGNIAFEVKNAFLKFTVADPVTLTASEGLFGGDLTELTFEEAGVHYVAVNAGVEATLEYKVGESMGKNLKTTFEAKKIYNLGNLTKSIASDSNGKYYTELATAFKLAESGATITLSSDITSTEQIVVPADKEFVLDLGGCTIDGQIGSVEAPANTNLGIFYISAGAKLTVKNGNINATIHSDYDGVNWSYGWNSAIFFNQQGELIIESGNYTISSESDGMIVCVVDNMSNWSNLNTVTTIKGGTFTYEKANGVIIRNRSNNPSDYTGKAIVNIEGGTFNGNDSRIWYHQTSTTNNGYINISGGVFNSVRFTNSNSKFTSRETWGNYKITGGTFNINTVKQLDQLSEAVRNAVSYKGATVALSDNIDYANGEFKAIGGVEISLDGTGFNTKGYFHMFRGTFDGKGKTISNMTIVAADNFDSFGLFGGLSTGAVVKDVTLNNITINSTHYAGALAGWIGTADADCEISGITVKNSNITVDTEVVGEGYDNGDKAGGVVGYMVAGEIKDCVVTETKINGYRDLGGIVGYGRNIEAANNKVDDTVVITVNNVQNYKEYAIQADYSVNNYVGDFDATCTLSSNSGDATIVWGDIPATLVTYVAQIDETKYETFEAALEAAEASSTIELLADIESGDIITINKNITINGNNKTINSTAARAINIATEGEVTIKNLTVVATGERAVNVITYPATVKLEGVNLTASNYTVNVATSAGAAQVDIKKSTLRGLNTVNINGAGAEVTIDGCEIYCDDNNTTQGEDYAALCLGKDAVDGSIVATNTDIYVTEGSDSTKGCNNASGGTITIDGSTDGVVVKYAAIIYGDYYYAFDTVDEAIEFDETATIVLLRDATIGTVGTYTIEVNGHNLSAAENFILTDNLDGTYTVVAAKAKIGSTLYATLAEAIDKATGADIITLLAPINDATTLDKACTIDTKGFAFNYTVTNDFKATVENGVITVVAKVYVAQVGTTKYESFAEAYAAGTEITLLAAIINDTPTLDKACTIDTKGFAFNYTVANDFKETVENGVITVVAKQAYRVYVLDNCGWTKKIHAWDTNNNITGDWNTTSINTKHTINGFEFVYYEFDKSYDGKTVNYIISNNGDDYWRKEFNDVILNSDKYYRINAVGEVFEIDPNNLSTFKFTLYVYDQNGVDATHSLYYASTATGTAQAESGRVGYNWKNYDYFVLDGSKIGTDFKVSVKDNNGKTITNLSISKSIKTDLCIGYYNNSGGQGYWANGTTPYTSLLNN